MNDRAIFVIIVLVLILTYTVFTFRRLLLIGNEKWKEKVNVNPATQKSYSKNDFINAYTTNGYSEKTVTFVYDKTQEFLKAKDIVLLSEDDLIRLYERQENEWIYVVKKWLIELYNQVPNDSELIRDLQPLNFESLIKVIEQQRHQSAEI